MKILIVTGGYLPAQKYGGPVTSLVNFVSQLGDEYEIEIVTRNHDLHEKKPFDGVLPGFNTVGKAKVLYLPDSELGFQSFNRIIAERKPDCLYLSSIFDMLLIFLCCESQKRKIFR